MHFACGRMWYVSSGEPGGCVFQRRPHSGSHPAACPCRVAVTLPLLRGRVPFPLPWLWAGVTVGGMTLCVLGATDHTGSVRFSQGHRCLGPGHQLRGFPEQPSWGAPGGHTVLFLLTSQRSSFRVAPVPGSGRLCVGPAETWPSRGSRPSGPSWMPDAEGPQLRGVWTQPDLVLAAGPSRRCFALPGRVFP